MVALTSKMFILPVRIIVNTGVVANGDSGSDKPSPRHTLFTAEYKDYQPASAH